ncbi:MAG: carbohydrate ABC transporter permease [Anaerolineae bacterium]|jgi:ABC-type glycerol-3-phosphate transport system permease component|uniref:carbohydrate ABC transporter permease n=1 Tax=Candidatus Flexifilum breve TaxID=3140694 RepID=UPI001AD1FB4B|nr:carbohydrate ABC transporter permease [Chloroflexota bacterium]MBK9750897.1 carbohydrate ABC transporter permease [Chloroflexota bacterium]MBN8637178.1 carbohydrate ABC transporter permease [Anaerolineae bacterium]
MAESARPIDLTTAKSTTRKPISWGTVFVYAVLIIGLVQALFPFAWMISASLMTQGEVIMGRLFPEVPQFGNYAEAWAKANFSQFVWNSVRITAITLFGQLAVSIPAAYAFARMRFFGKNVFFTLTLATIMIPEVARFIPNYLTVIWLGRLSENLLGVPWINNWPALSVPFWSSAFTIFLLRQFFAQIPEDLWDAARIDGAGHPRFLWSVVMPLSRAPIMTSITFGFIGSWNALLWPLLVTQTDEWRPVAVGLTKFVSSDAPNSVHLQMAAGVLMIIPILALYFFTQRQFVEGISSSGLKG